MNDVLYFEYSDKSFFDFNFLIAVYSICIFLRCEWILNRAVMRYEISIIHMYNLSKITCCFDCDKLYIRYTH